jgi:hypothetical protein
MKDETRRVIAVVDDLVPHKEAIAFPVVRAWLRSAEDIEIHNLKSAFPAQGEVFLHTSHAHNERLSRHQVGLFECIRSKGQHNAHWEVDSTLRTLARVLDYPSKTAGNELLNLWKWAISHRERDHCSILLGENVVYVNRGGSAIVGPFSIGAEGALVLSNATFSFENIAIARIEIANRRYGFVDVEQLPTGRPLILDPREAFLRRLKLIHRKNQFGWLSRDKIQALATAAANAAAADGSEWVNEGLSDVLSAAYDSSAPDEAVISAVLAVPEFANSVETAWKAKHLDQVSKSKEEIGKVTARVSDLTTEAKSLEGDLASLTNKIAAGESELERLKSEIENTRNEAARLFDNELKRLAKSPATLALFSSWGTTMSDGSGRAHIIVGECQRGEEEKVGDLHEALRSNFRNSGLAALTASEIATAGAAAIAAGQCVCFQSTYSDVLIHAAGMACAEYPIFAASISAGLLDPVDWDQFLPAAKRLVLLLQGANRSDVSLVLGSLRMPLLRQNLGIQRMPVILFLGLESQLDLRVEGEIPAGPIVDDRVVNVDAAKASTKMCSASFDGDISQQIPPMDRETFAIELGDPISKLPMFSAPSSGAVYRRGYAALRKRVSDVKDARRIFFKYWCFPRLPRQFVEQIVAAHRQEWERDELLMRLAETESTIE